MAGGDWTFGSEGCFSVDGFFNTFMAHNGFDQGWIQNLFSLTNSIPTEYKRCHFAPSGLFLCFH